MKEILFYLIILLTVAIGMMAMPQQQWRLYNHNSMVCLSEKLWGFQETQATCYFIESKK